MNVGNIFTTEEKRAPTFLEWFRGKKVVPYVQEWVVKAAYSGLSRCTYAERTYTGALADLKDITPQTLGTPMPRRHCKHECRVPRVPSFSVGDESDYISTCFHCGRLLRDEPNF
jgi:hypothetical protein